MHSLGFRISFIVSLLGGLACALPYPLKDLNFDWIPMRKSARSANTCADPSLVKPIYQAFETSPGLLHDLNFLWVFEDFNTRTNSVFADLHPAFYAWPTQQEFTVPLFQLGTADGTQLIFLTGADANTPPVVSGFNSNVALIAWVYSSQVCGSVPLMSAVLGGTFSDHYYTTDNFTHSGLLHNQWVDGGVVAFVLPLNGP